MKQLKNCSTCRWCGYSPTGPRCGPCRGWEGHGEPRWEPRLDVSIPGIDYPVPEIVPAKDQQIGGDHYKKLAIQPWEYCMSNNLDPCSATAIKYITRHKDKGGKQDLEKAVHAIQWLIEWEYGDGKKRS